MQEEDLIKVLKTKKVSIQAGQHILYYVSGKHGFNRSNNITGFLAEFGYEHYDSSYWSDKNDYGLPEGATTLDKNEVKVLSYWNTPFTKICLGMEVNGQRNFLVIEESVSSLYSLIADVEHRDTSLGRDK
ncbi:hypothetical protein ACROYT_G008817 [Oculina patagonica]